MPLVDENKGSLELSLEVIIQSILLFIGILLINKAIRYFPTYSGVNYQPMDMISLVPIFLVIMIATIGIFVWGAFRKNRINYS